jgi:2-dehydro-3-deoxygalactonokinase
VLHAADAASIVGINWGSSRFRAYLIDANGTVSDSIDKPSGVVGLDRKSMTALVEDVAARWTLHSGIYLAGMIGSNVGWVEVPYANAPAGAAELAAAVAAPQMGRVAVRIVPGIACTRTFDNSPEILRGEEIELLGLAALHGGGGLISLPGTHTKWAQLEQGRVVDFFTSMSGEIYDRLTTQGLLASIVEGDAQDGGAFLDGVEAGRARSLGITTLLFGARARVIRNALPRRDAASYLRGLLIGSELADAERIFGIDGKTIPVVGNGPLSRLYASALAASGARAVLVPSQEACARGFRILHEAVCA